MSLIKMLLFPLHGIRKSNWMVTLVLILFFSGCVPSGGEGDKSKDTLSVSTQGCGTPHSRTGALLQSASSASQKPLVILSNGATYSAKMDTSHWPAKPWPKKMVWVPTSIFLMGGFGKEIRPDELPVHEVTVDGFWMDQTEVTNEEFAQFVKKSQYITTAEVKPDWEELKLQLPPGTPKPADDVLVPGSLVFTQTTGPVPLNNVNQWWSWVPGANWKYPNTVKESVLENKAFASHPVVQVSWYDVVSYAKWAGKRLPTEAEWECAARGGKAGQSYGWGEDSPNEKNIKANIWQGKFPYQNTQEDGFVLTSPVARYAPNEYGLYDMMGNVWEWCADWYRPDTYETDKKKSKVQNPRGPKDSFDPDEPHAPKRVVRGGSFLCHSSYCASYRPSARMKTSPDTGENHTGFRCVMSDKEWRATLSHKKNQKTAL
jgi:formylglycine-generating enzyme required for sulfatase activity